jgi:hypothetical protein
VKKINFFETFEIDDEAWNRTKRIYLLGLSVLVFCKNPAGPILDCPPLLCVFQNLGVFHLDSNSQILAFQALAFVSLLSAGVYFYRSALVLTVGLVAYSLHLLTAYATVYTRQFDYLPHGENIHAFILGVLAVQSAMSESFTRVEARRLLMIIFGWTYFAAAITKLRLVGWSWANGETLQSWFAIFWMYSDNPISLWLAQSPVLAKLIGYATIAFELAVAPALFIRFCRWPVVIAAVSLHVTVWVTLGINFLPSYLLVAIFFVAPRLPRVPTRFDGILSRISRWRHREVVDPLNSLRQ